MVMNTKLNLFFNHCNANESLWFIIYPILPVRSNPIENWIEKNGPKYRSGNEI